MPGLTGHLLEGIIVRIQSHRRDAGGGVFLKAGADYGHLAGLRVVKVYVPCNSVSAHGFLHRRKDGLEEELLFLELDFGLGGMDVYVYGGGIYVQVEEIGGRGAVRDKVFIGLHHGLVEVGAAEIPAVHKEKLVPKGFAGAFRAAGVSAEGDYCGIGLNVHNVSHNGGAKEVLDAEFEAFDGLYHVDVTTVVGKGEADVRSREGNPLEFLHYVPKLNVVGFEELPSCRDVIEEVADGYICANRAGDFLGALVLRRRHLDFHAGFFLCGAGPEGYFGHGGN